jgi:hypothetical protein
MTDQGVDDVVGQFRACPNNVVGLLGFIHGL